MSHDREIYSYVLLSLDSGVRIFANFYLAAKKIAI